MAIFLRLLPLVFLLLGSCSSAPRPFPVPQGAPLQVNWLARTAQVDALAISPDGKIALWSDKDLNYFNIGTNRHQHLLDQAVEKLCWSPDGQYFAAIIRVDGESQLLVYQHDGTLFYRRQLAGRVGRLLWPVCGRLSLSLVQLTKYRFGTQVEGKLLQWDGNWRLLTTPIFETTITPATAHRLAGKLQQTFDFDFSCLGDEILYTRLHAPPAFAPERRLVLRNLQSNKERVLTSMPLLSGRARLLADGERMWLNAGTGQLELRRLWRDQTEKRLAAEDFVYQADADLLLVQGKLFSADQPGINFPSDGRYQFSPHGRFLMTFWQGNIYLIRGYPVRDYSPYQPVEIKKLQKLRRLRSLGLITPEDYRKTKEHLRR